MNEYKSIEQKWQKVWEDEKAFVPINDTTKPKCYVLEMLPYPSGKIHVGHLRNYAIGDVFARFMKAKGYNVLHPMGWDSFGLPAENAAIANNSHPADWTYGNIDAMRKQLKSIGFSYDWSREIVTCDPDYYKHEQKFFLELFEKGLAYQKESIVNWDPVDQTVLANEQVVDGKGWRSGALVEKRYLKQWFLKVTDYADELLRELDNLTGWPDSVRSMQTKWIGKSEGANFKFKVKGLDAEVEVFSTKPETIFGASFVAVAYNHNLIEQFVMKSADIQNFITKCTHMSTATADIETAEKDGVFTGLYAIHPFDDSILLPIYIANFVLRDYGTGALFGCPGHDIRDQELALKMKLPIKQVISDDRIMINSDFLDGMTVEEAKQRVIQEFEKRQIGFGVTNYRLKDWGISRQRFWGCPIPIIHCNTCGIVQVPDSDLPVVLPKEVSFDKTGNPLSHNHDWVNVKCPKCNAPATRETDTFDTFFESSWYFTRYIDPNALEMTNSKLCDYWMPIDQYIGGVEHAVMHLLYARFFTKVMQEHGYVSVREPFKNLLTQGMVLHVTYKNSKGNWLYPWEVEIRDGKLVEIATGDLATSGKIEKMSKSKKNVIDLENILGHHSADVVRMFALSDSPPEKDLEWSASGIEGCQRFVAKLVAMGEFYKANSPASTSVQKIVHQTIKAVTEDIASFRLNRAIARIRELFNALSDDPSQEGFTVLLRLLNPFIPHITEEIWENLGNSRRLYSQAWPTHDESLLSSDTYTLAIQVNGKLRATHEFDVSITEQEIKDFAITMPEVVRHINDLEIKKMILIPKKVLNIVV